MIDSYVELVRHRLENRSANIMANLEKLGEGHLRFTMRIFGDCLDEEARGSFLRDTRNIGPRRNSVLSQKSSSRRTPSTLSRSCWRRRRTGSGSTPLISRRKSTRRWRSGRSGPGSRNTWRKSLPCSCVARSPAWGCSSGRTCSRTPASTRGFSNSRCISTCWTGSRSFLRRTFAPRPARSLPWWEAPSRRSRSGSAKSFSPGFGPLPRKPRGFPPIRRRCWDPGWRGIPGRPPRGGSSGSCA